MPCRRCISKRAPRAPAICTMAAMVPALWLANCGTITVVVPEQCTRRGQVGDVGVLLVREHRVALEARFLRALDLAVPVRALDQAHHELQLSRTRDARHLVDDLEHARLVRLHRQAEAAPARRVLLHVGRQCIEHLQRELEAIALLGVDGEVDVGRGGEVEQRRQARHQLGHHARVVRVFVARVQRRQLDRDAVAFECTVRRRRLPAHRLAARRWRGSPCRTNRGSAARRARCARPRRACRTKSAVAAARAAASRLRRALRRCCGRARTGGRAAGSRARWLRPPFARPGARANRAARRPRATSVWPARSHWTTAWPTNDAASRRRRRIGAAQLIGRQRDRRSRRPAPAAAPRPGASARAPRRC